MTSPALAFAPGSPAAAGSVAQDAIGKAMGAAGISVPGFTSSSSSRSGDIGQTFGSDNSGFNVNYGTSWGQGGTAAAAPWWVWAGVLVLGLVWIKRKPSI